ncbi:diacylglycerol/lipid kinase family protein [Leucobacter massiliensis]|uniref:Diacylglycerol kinase n=1 Tax=Leucobacter massiliensis TaxID=1686285 RepID=A0A2S9QNV5_9MICO|nr:diacylglycerol kinase family protein [Leucobacter massiliensis]PRI11264.1 diacylglycerol kinase [Leucobacter massiliensis]
MSGTIGIVWNPSKVGEEELRADVAEAVERSVSAGDAPPECLWFPTTVEDPGMGQTAEAIAQGCGVVVAAGGDGTVRVVAEALGSTGVPAAELGILPLGTGNLLARNLGVPVGDTRAAFARVLAGASAPLDLGVVDLRTADGREERHGFVVMAGFGIDAQMIVETDDELKARTGWLAYVESLGRAAVGAEVVEFALRLDDAEPLAERAHTVLIANCGSLMGGITLLPDAAPDDGQLDLLVLRADDPAAWLGTMKNVMWDNGLKRLITGAEQAQSSGSTAYLRAGRVRVALPAPLVFELDGDEVGAVVEIDARILPGALRVR